MVRATLADLRARCEAIGSGRPGEWRRLQFDAVTALIDAQRAFVTLHGQIVHALRYDRALYQRLRLESIELALANDALRELVRTIERALVTFD